ncbi:MAG TPA: hypothetical protein VGC66_24445 [Pyrinomonadaceae bacterium]|jgi:hypothetical protein
MAERQRLRKALSKASLRNIASVILLLIFISVAGIAAGAWSLSAGGAKRLPIPSCAAPPASQVETVSVVLGTRAFTPASTTRAAGAFRLEVTNQSGAQEVTLQLRRDNGGALVQEWRVQSGAAQTWSEVIDLAQGGYTLSVAENPACLFHITLE